MQITEAYNKYTENGFACHPTKQDKSPFMKDSWNNGFGIESFNGAFGIGVICGAISGGLECLDFDNHFGDAKQILGEYVNIPEVKTIYEKYHLPIESSMTGGFHLLFRCAKNEGNRKLAQRKNTQGRPEAFIESRGEGGYFCAYPTPGYLVVKNDIFNISQITEFERSVLIDNAVSMNEFFPSIIVTEFESGERPGDIYNSDNGSIQEMKNILGNAGWKQVDGYKWRRPGKNDGISATLGKVAPNILYVFTSNAYPFEPMKAYTPFQVLSLIKYNGDFSEAAKSLVPDKPLPFSKPTPPAVKPSELEKLLAASRIDTKKSVPKPPTILSIRENSGTTSTYKRMFTLGNFSCIIGKAKSKKTFLLSLLTASLLNSEASHKFYGELTNGKNVILYFDTEQGEYDSYNVIRRIEYMAGTNEGLNAFNLRPYSPAERCQIIEYAMEIFGSRIGFCVIDGIADLATGINDEEEATRVTTMLLRLSKVNNCHIATVIHQNKNDNFATGHLGSAIMKKAEIIISVTKSKDDKSAADVSNEMSRGVDFEPFQFVVNHEGIPEVTGAIIKKQPMKPSFETEQESEDSPDIPF